MHELRQVQHLRVLGAHFPANAREPSRADFQISHPDHIVIAHTHGNLPSGLCSQCITPGFAPGIAIQLQHPAHLPEILFEIMQILIVSNCNAFRPRGVSAWAAETLVAPQLPLRRTRHVGSSAVAHPQWAATLDLCEPINPAVNICMGLSKGLQTLVDSHATGPDSLLEAGTGVWERPRGSHAPNITAEITVP